MKIRLTENQVRALMPFYERVKIAAVAGSPGMLVAQVSWREQDGDWWMTPAFLPHEVAKLITEKGEGLGR